MNDVTKRVIQVFKYLQYKGIVKNKVDFCKRIKYQKQNWHEVETGTREFPKRKIEMVISTFNVSPDYIFFGQKPMLTLKSANKEVTTN